MADDVKLVPITDPNAKGIHTSEGKFTLASVVAGMGAMLAGIGTVVATVLQAQPVLEQLHNSFPMLPYVGLALAALGSLHTVAQVFGWTSKRTALKQDIVAAAEAAGEAAANAITSNDQARAAMEGRTIPPAATLEPGLRAKLP